MVDEQQKNLDFYQMAKGISQPDKNREKMNLPAVSLIIPCFNGEKYLPDFMDSLFAQNYSPVEIIFSDDGSTDRTEEIFRSYEKKMPEKWSFKYIKQSHAGQAAATSNALPHVTGKYLMWSDADDLMLPGSIAEKADFLTANPDYGMVRNNFYYYKEDGTLKIGCNGVNSNAERIFERIFDSTLPCLAGTYMMRSSLLFSCYPERKIPLSEEGQNFQLLLPAASRSKCGFIDKPLMEYRVHPDSHSNRPRNLGQQLKRAKGFLKLRKDLLSYCKCDREYFAKLAKKIFDCQKTSVMELLLKSMKNRSDQKSGNLAAKRKQHEI